MKKILLSLFLLTPCQLTFANCNGIVNWTMNIKNGTEHDIIHLDCDPKGDLAPGESYSYTGFYGTGSSVACDRSSYSGVSCNYTDTTTGQSGAVSLVFNTCTKTSSGQASNVNPTSFACSVTQGYSSGGGRVNCDDIDGYSYNSYVTGGSFVIVNKGPSYQLDWTGVKMHAIKGQVLADKLALNLLKTGSYISSAANYNQSTSTITINLQAPTDDPCS